MSEDERLNAICDARKGGPFINVRLCSQKEVDKFMRPDFLYVMHIDNLIAINPKPSPIRTAYIGTIAFQGTDAEIEEMQRRTFGKEESQ